MARPEFLPINPVLSGRGQRSNQYTRFGPKSGSEPARASAAHSTSLPPSISQKVEQSSKYWMTASG